MANYASEVLRDLYTICEALDEAQKTVKELETHRLALIEWGGREGVKSREMARALKISEGRLSQLMHSVSRKINKPKQASYDAHKAAKKIRGAKNAPKW